MIIDYICFTVIIFLSLLQWIVIIEVILSWLKIFGFNISIFFIQSITYPIYFYIKKIIPTTFGPIDFTPVVIIIFLEILFKIIIIIRPSVTFLL
ncbi:YggT family protein [Candidatus Gracilibacteria bacterium]|nr:YggT family protein [Candidatus Gracilibacteria bacterium]